MKVENRAKFLLNNWSRTDHDPLRLTPWVYWRTTSPSDQAMVWLLSGMKVGHYYATTSGLSRDEPRGGFDSTCVL